jgi:D-mannonate dehydratase
MKETWRWYGEDLDKIQLSEIRQTGASAKACPSTRISNAGLVT